VNDRGFTLTEVLVAALVASVVLLATGSLYVSTLRAHREDDSLTYLQRQGTLILEEIGLRVRPAVTIQGPPGQATACGGVAGSVQADVPDFAGGIQVFCYRLDAAGGTQLMKDDVTAGTSRNMLSGTPFAMTVSACPAAAPPATWPDGVNIFNVHNDPLDRPERVEVCFVVNNTTVAPKAVTFQATFTCRPCNEV